MRAIEESPTRRVHFGTAPGTCALVAAAAISATLAFSFSTIAAAVALPGVAVTVFVAIAVVQRVAVPARARRPFLWVALISTSLVAATASAWIVYRSTWRERFRELLVDPVPTSVANATIDEVSVFSDEGFLRFDISPADVEAVAGRRGMIWLADAGQDPIRYEYVLADWPLYNRPANRRVAQGPAIVLVYDVDRRVAWVAVDHLAAAVGRD